MTAYNKMILYVYMYKEEHKNYVIHYSIVNTLFFSLFSKCYILSIVNFWTLNIKASIMSFFIIYTFIKIKINAIISSMLNFTIFYCQSMLHNLKGKEISP